MRQAGGTGGGTIRRIVGGLLVGLAIFLAGLTLSAWWLSVDTARSATSLSAAVQSSITGHIGSELSTILPNGAIQPSQVNQTIQSDLQDPALQKKITSAEASGATPDAADEQLTNELTQQLSSVDPSVASQLGGKDLSLGGLQTLGGTGLDINSKLRRVASDARLAALSLGVGAALLALVGVVVHPQRSREIRRIARWALTAGGLALLTTSIIPALVSANSHGMVRRIAHDDLQVGGPVRLDLIALAVAGIALTVVGEIMAVRELRANPPGQQPAGRSRRRWPVGPT